MERDTDKVLEALKKARKHIGKEPDTSHRRDKARDERLAQLDEAIELMKRII